MLYVAAYCGTVVRNVISFHEGDADLPDTLLTTPNYRFGGEWACDFFSPMHALDKRMRPRVLDDARVFRHVMILGQS